MAEKNEVKKEETKKDEPKKQGFLSKLREATDDKEEQMMICLLYTSPSPRDNR